MKTMNISEKARIRNNCRNYGGSAKVKPLRDYDYWPVISAAESVLGWAAMRYNNRTDVDYWAYNAASNVLSCMCDALGIRESALLAAVKAANRHNRKRGASRVNLKFDMRLKSEVNFKRMISW